MSSELLTLLTVESRAIVDTFTRWLQLSMDQCRRELHVEAVTYQNSSVIYDQYSRDQALDMLRGELMVLQGVVNAHMTSWSSAIAALMTAVLHEADRQRLTLEIDVLSLLREGSGHDRQHQHHKTLHSSNTLHGSDRDPLRRGEAENSAEGATHAGGNSSSLGSAHEAANFMELMIKGPRTRLAPLTIAEAGGEAARQLAEANEKIKVLRAKLQRASKEHTEKRRSRRSSSTATPSGHVGNDAEAVDGMNANSRTNHDNSHRDDNVTGHVSSGDRSEGEDELRALRDELAAMKEQLTRRLSQSPQVKELRSLLIQRNKQLHELQQRLAQLDATFRCEHQRDGVESEAD